MNRTTKILITGAATVGAILAANSQSLAQEEFYSIRARHSGQCLNVLDAGRNNGDNVVQAAECNADSSQWRLIPAEAGYYYLEARHSGLCLNVLNAGRNNGDNVVQGDECHSDNFQWALIPADSQFDYIEARHSGQCLNVLNAGRNNGDNVVQGDECRSDNFQWEIVRARSSPSRPHNSRYERPERHRSEKSRGASDRRREYLEEKIRKALEF